MDAMRLIRGGRLTPLAPCERCQVIGCPWDRVAGKPLCPDCQEMLMLGTAPPLSEPLEKRPCAVCERNGIITYQTFPLQKDVCLEIDLCPCHLEGLMARRLDGMAIQRLAHALTRMGLHIKDIFLLHEAFYNDEGEPLQPVPDQP